MANAVIDQTIEQTIYIFLDIMLKLLKIFGYFAKNSNNVQKNIEEA